MVNIQFFFYNVSMKISKSEVKPLIEPYVHSRLFNDETIEPSSIKEIHDLLSPYDNVIVQVFTKRNPYIEIIIKGMLLEDTLRYNISSDDRDWIDELEDIDAFF